MTPRYFITEINANNCATRAQDFVDNQVRSLLYRSVTDDADLDRLEKYLKVVAERAHDNFPRAQLITVDRQRFILGGYTFNFRSGSRTYNSFVTVRVVEIRGGWEGGQK